MNLRPLRVAIGAALIAGRVLAQCPYTWTAIEPGGFSFTTAAHSLTHWDPDGAGPLAPRLVAGGEFNSIGGAGSPCIGMWDGLVWQPIGPGMNGAVTAVTVYNGELIAGGYFTYPAERIARWDGANWYPLGSGLNYVPWAFTVYNGDLIAAGGFTTAGGISAPSVARWNGSSWASLGTGTNGTLLDATVHNGELVVGGAFSMAGGVSALKIARWNGLGWQPLGSGVDINVQSLCSYNGELIAAGEIGYAGGVLCNNIARWNGVAWQSLGQGMDAMVETVAPYNGSLFAAGQFSTAGGVASPKFARWNGAAWQATPPPGLSASIYGMTTDQNSLFVAGEGLVLPGATAFSVVGRLNAELPPPSFTQPGGPGTGVHVTNTGLVSGDEYRNVASFDLCGPVGSGPYAGLCFNDVSFLLWQLAFPVGFHPFHFIATYPVLVVGPYGAPSGMTFDALCANTTGGVVTCISDVVRYTIQ